MSIQPLSPDTIAQIKSSTLITSLNGVVCELVKNSLDSGATKISINVNYRLGGCTVEDDGLGIPPAEFGEDGGLGKQYHTSKLTHEGSLYGYRGAFLACLSTMALISITSRHHLHQSHNALTMHKSHVIDRQIPASTCYALTRAYGTKVTVRDLFGSMPVRVKQRAAANEKHGHQSKLWEALKRQIILLILPLHRDISLTLFELETNQRIVIKLPSLSSGVCGKSFHWQTISSILCQAGFISLDENISWVPVSASTPNLNICGTISLDAKATKTLQFLSFGIHPIQERDGKTILHDEVNRLFSNSDFGNMEEADTNKRDQVSSNTDFRSNRHTNKELKGEKRGIERWPMFYLNIQRIQGTLEFDPIEANIILENSGGGSFNEIMELLQTLVLAFLSKHNFRPIAPRSDCQILKRRSFHEDIERSPAQLSAAGFHAESSAPPSNINVTSQLRTKPPRIVETNDLSGASIKLPNFSQASKCETPFATWSRIKSGTAKELLSNPKTEPQDVHLNRASTASPTIRTSSLVLAKDSSTLHSRSRSKTPLLSKEGKLIRPPFKINLHNSFPIGQSPPELDNCSASVDEKMASWIDPISNFRSVVNTRTGHILPAECRTMTGRTTHPSVVAKNQLMTTLNTRNKILLEGPHSPWISDAVKNWDNPVFHPTEAAIPQVVVGNSDVVPINVPCGNGHINSESDIEKFFKELPPIIHGQISREALSNSTVISQVDKKFILVKVQIMRGLNASADQNMLVIIDQHAADERIRVEQLMEGFCAPAQRADSGVMTVSLDTRISFEISAHEAVLLNTWKQHFARWGILYEIIGHEATCEPHQKDQNDSLWQLCVQSIPPSILERCKANPRLLIELIRAEAWNIHDEPNFVKAPPSGVIMEQSWLEKMNHCPQGIVGLLNSRACRSAIMFNDALDGQQCRALIKNLARCKLPFQCAHGRPSLVPLVGLGPVVPEFLGMEHPGQNDTFGSRFRAWRQSCMM